MTAHARRIARAVTLDDKYELLRGRVYLSGVQALVRLPLDQIRRDRAAGLKTAGFISGYRGSPLGGYDQQLERAAPLLGAHGVVFQPGINEDLAATAVWGAQKVGLHPGATHDGVFGIWYGKSPGVDRSGDALRHANMTGTARHGGALAIAGDDHLAKSSSLPNQSEFAFVDWEIPLLSPSDIQDVLDFGLFGLALSRYAGTWAALIAPTEQMDASAVIDVDPLAHLPRLPRDHPDPRADIEINRLLELASRFDTEVLMREVRLPAARAFVRANEIEGVRFGAARARFGIVASGKAYRDLMQTLELMGIDEALARRAGLAVYKVAMPWPLEGERLARFARPLERLLVVENKRALIEPQIKELLYHLPAGARPAVWGKVEPSGAALLPAVRDLGPAEIGPALLRFLPADRLGADAAAAVARLAERRDWAREHAGKAVRLPFFCSGCPHNTGTRLPEGSRAASGIGCHVMTDLMGRTTEGSTQMGAEGVHWLGQFPFTAETHVFVNLGDGTYYHSGSLAVRAAVAARARVTFKILYNDAVAMTGGQPVDGPLSVERIARQLAAEGVDRVAIVAEEPSRHVVAARAAGVELHPRADYLAVQAALRAYPGVSAVIYDQTCAAEKRRRRKHGTWPDPDRRIFINPRVCEDCGDCSVQSNCISVEPLETEFGTRRRINQSSCNKDFSCVQGFCPSFVELAGAVPRKARSGLDFEALAAALPRPAVRFANTPHNVLFAGIGGTGVTTISAVLAMAAHLDGQRATTLDVTGLAQKGGPVTSQIRIAPAETPIHGPRIAPGELDLLLAADPIVAAGADVLALTGVRRTFGVLNAAVAPTAEFVLHRTQSHDAGALAATLDAATAARCRADFTGAAERLFGDAIFANMMLLGAAWQAGRVPVSQEALRQAIELNGVAPAQNWRAFAAGRLMVADPSALDMDDAAPPPAMPLDERIAFLEAELVAYQDRAYATAFRTFVDRVKAADEAVSGPGRAFTRAVAEGLYRLMAYKDEYEVARLYADPAFVAALRQQFEGDFRLSVQLAPPLFARRDPATGRSRKRRYGPWILPAMRLLARLKRLRGTLLDPFGHTRERRAERALAAGYRALIGELVPGLAPDNYALAVRIAGTAGIVRGYGPVKEANMARARAEQDRLLAEWRGAPGSTGEPFLAAAE